MTTQLSQNYSKPSGSYCGEGDTGTFLLDLPESSTIVPLAPDDAPIQGTCTPTSTSLCLLNGRFRVRVERNGVAQGAAGVTSQSGAFYFSNPLNPEVVVKVLDGRQINGWFWVFFGSLTDQSYEVIVEDTEGSGINTYPSPAPHCGDADTLAFQ